jgi:nucleoside-diphosphate-sugar epimerase
MLHAIIISVAAFVAVQVMEANSDSFFMIHNENGNKAVVFYPQKSLSCTVENAEDVFHDHAFKVPKMLEIARLNQCPALLVLPKNIEGTTPLHANAFWIEGARVALAWASAYFRFLYLGNVDVRVLLYDDQHDISSEEIDSALAALLVKTISDDKKTTPEMRMKERLISFDGIATDDAQISTIKRSDLVVEEVSMDRKVIDPVLDQLAPGQYRILVTGGAGFLGSHIVKALDNKQCMFVHHDVSQPFQIQGPLTHVMHLASIASPVFYYAQPQETLLAGLHGTKNTLEVAVQKGARYLFSSTSEVYGDAEISPQSEEYHGRVNPIGMRSQYDQSKRGGETLIKLYTQKYDLDVRIIRIFNTYGPHMSLHDGRVVTNFIQAILEKKSLPIYGDGLQTRSFAYVDDTVQGIIAILLCPAIEKSTPIDQRVFNIGNPIEFTIVELAEKARLLANKHLHIDIQLAYHPQPDANDPKQRRPDIRRAKELVGFNPSISLDEGLEKTFIFFSE